MRLTRLLSTSRERARAKAVGWLLDSSRDHGGLELPEANAILTTLDKTPGLQPSVKALKSLGVAGLAQLRDAVATDWHARSMCEGRKPDIANALSVRTSEAIATCARAHSASSEACLTAIGST